MFAATSVSLPSKTFPVPSDFMSTFPVPADCNCSVWSPPEADLIVLAYKFPVSVVSEAVTVTVLELPTPIFTLPLPLLRVATPVPPASNDMFLPVVVVMVGVPLGASLICKRGDARTFPVISNPERLIPLVIVLVPVKSLPNIVPVAPNGFSPFALENRIPCNQPVVPPTAPI